MILSHRDVNLAKNVILKKKYRLQFQVRAVFLCLFDIYESKLWHIWHYYFIKCRFASVLPVVSAFAVSFPPVAVAFGTAVAASVVFVIPAAGIDLVASKIHP